MTNDELSKKINVLLLKHELIKVTDWQECEYGSDKPITFDDDIKSLCKEHAAAQITAFAEEVSNKLTYNGWHNARCKKIGDEFTFTPLELVDEVLKRYTEEKDETS